MSGKTGSRRRKAHRGPCSYCSKVHKKGKKRGDSCRGHGSSQAAERKGS